MGQCAPVIEYRYLYVTHNMVRDALREDEGITDLLSPQVHIVYIGLVAS